jgi:hypothetical protein
MQASGFGVRRRVAAFGTRRSRVAGPRFRAQTCPRIPEPECLCSKCCSKRFRSGEKVNMQRDPIAGAQWMLAIGKNFYAPEIFAE